MNRRSNVSSLIPLLFLLLSSPLAAQELSAPSPLGGDLALGDSPPPPATIVAVKLELESGGAAPGDPVRGTLVATIDPEWHINSSTPKDDFAIPTVLRIESPAIEAGTIHYPPHVERAFEFAGGELLAVWEGTIRIPFEGTRTAAGDTTLTAILSYQACNDRVCLPPREATASLAVSAAGVATETAAPPPAGSFTPLADAPEGGGLLSGDVGATLEARGLVLTLGVVFLLGLALNLTPCVYPLIPITVAFFTSQTGGSRGRRTGLAISYVLGLAAMYSALGVFSALSGRLFGAWLQLPAVLVFFAALMLVLATSMFGAFEIKVPHFISDRAGARSGMLGAATMGLLAGIVAAPCVGPFIISLIALVSQRGSVPFGFLLFFVLALGLGFPYLLLGIFSSGLKSIPRSGSWMVLIKQALGFVLVAMAFYFLRPLLGDEVYRWGAGLSLLIGALFLLLRGWSSKQATTVRVVCGLALLAGGLFFLWPRHLGPEVEWQPYEAQALEHARLAGRPVVIDFYADWCLPCKELDEKTFTDATVIAESERFVRLKADLTKSKDPKVLALSKEYAILGVPTIVFIERDGAEAKSVRLTGFENPEEFVKRLQAVR